MSSIYSSLDKIKIVYELIKNGNKLREVRKSEGFVGGEFLPFIFELRVIIANAINGRNLKCKNDCEVRIVVDVDSGEYSCFLGDKNLMVDGVMSSKVLDVILSMK